MISVAKDFWNLRGSFKVGKVLDIGTHVSLVRRANGKFVFLDSYALNNRVRKAVDVLTDGGKDVEAIVNLHPFHTVHVKAMHAAFPNAKLYGTARHCSRFAELPWEPTTSEDPATHALFAEELDFFVPRGVDFISSDESVHFSSVLAYHRSSKTLHVDDTLVYLPSPLRKIGFGDYLRFHPTLSKALEKRAGAARDFRAWATEVAERCGGLENLCAAHLTAFVANESYGVFPPQMTKALAHAERELAAHERKYG